MKSPGSEREPSEDEMLNLHVDVRACNESHKETIRRVWLFFVFVFCFPPSALEKHVLKKKVSILLQR